jgi:hypothetical protein
LASGRFRVRGSGFRVQVRGSGSGVSEVRGSRFRVPGSGSGSRFGVQVRGFPRFGVSGVQGSGVRGSRFFAEVQRPWRGSCRVEWVTTSASGPCGCTSERRAMIDDGQGPGSDGEWRHRRRPGGSLDRSIRHGQDRSGGSRCHPRDVDAHVPNRRQRIAAVRHRGPAIRTRSSVVGSPVLLCQTSPRPLSSTFVTLEPQSRKRFQIVISKRF